MSVPVLALAAPTVAACVRAPRPGGYRDATARRPSAPPFDPARFTDVWHVVASYGSEAACGPLAETWIATGAATYRVTGTACGPRGPRAFATEARVVGPGRLARRGLNGPEELWVLWVDADYRIAAVGTPDGSFARILSRLPEPRPDLFVAARDVLAFNGYDTARLARN